MKLTLHHINLATEKVAEMDAFKADLAASGVPCSDWGHMEG
ncbi:MAG: hypothetical protein WAO69_13155 [Aestuariivita sp.]